MSRRLRSFRWWESSAVDVHDDVRNVVRFLFEQDEDRRISMERAALLYGPGISLGHWSPQASTQLGGLGLNLIKALVHTQASVVVDKPAPRATFLTDGGDFFLQQRARGMAKLAAGVMVASGFDDQARADARLASLMGNAGVKILERDERPIVESVHAWQVLVDKVDAAEGRPQSMFQFAWVDRDRLKTRYPKHAEDLDKAGAGGMDDPWGQDTITDQVVVFEVWRLPSSPRAKDGRHVICTDTCTLVDEHWTDSTFPFAWLEAEKPIGQFWAPGIADEIWPIQLEINLCLLRMREMLHRIAVPRVFVQQGTRINPGPIGNTIGDVFTYVGPREPVFDVARAIAPDLWQWVTFLWDKAFSIRGISELASQGRKPAGLTSGQSLRDYADLSSGRMSDWGKNWQGYYCSAATQEVRLMRRIAQRNPDAAVTYLDRRRRRLERVRWADVSLDEDAYEIQVSAISSLPASGPGRRAQLDEWRNAKVIDDYEYRHLSELPDLEDNLDLQNGPRQVIEEACEEMLYGHGEYLPPEPYDDPKLARRIVTLHLARARCARNVPEERLDNLRRYLDKIDQYEEEATAAASASAGPAPALPPGAGGAPMLPPGVMPAA